MAMATAEKPAATPPPPADETPAKPEEEGKTDKKVDADKAKSPLAEEDYQLFEALNILKGMDMVQNRIKPEPPQAEATSGKVM